MRIAIVTTSYPSYAGDACGHFVETEAKHLARDAEVIVIAPSVEADTACEEHGRGDDEPTPSLCVVRCSGGSAFGWPGASARLMQKPWLLGDALLWLKRARRTLEECGPFDRIVAHWSVPSGWPVTLGMKGEVELISHGGDVRLLSALPEPLRSRAVGVLTRRASKWRFVSQSLFDDLAATLCPQVLRALASIATIRPSLVRLPDVASVDVAGATLATAVAALRQAHRAQPLYVCVARLVRSKNVDRAIAYVRTRTNGACLVIVGDGPERARLERLAAASGVNARFVGRTTRPDALAWIGAADALLHASRKEGLSTVVREAEALKVRVVTLG